MINIRHTTEENTRWNKQGGEEEDLAARGDASRVINAIFGVQRAATSPLPRGSAKGSRGGNTPPSLAFCRVETIPPI